MPNWQWTLWKHQIIHSIHSLKDKSKQYERRSSTSPDRWIQLSTSVFSFKIFSLLCADSLASRSIHFVAHKKLWFSENVVFLRPVDAERERERNSRNSPFYEFMWPFFVKSNKFYRREKNQERKIYKQWHIFRVYIKEEKKKHRNFAQQSNSFSLL